MKIPIQIQITKSIQIRRNKIIITFIFRRMNNFRMFINFPFIIIIIHIQIKTIRIFFINIRTNITKFPNEIFITQTFNIIIIFFYIIFTKHFKIYSTNTIFITIIFITIFLRNAFAFQFIKSFNAIVAQISCVRFFTNTLFFIVWIAFVICYYHFWITFAC